jgi:hypothetical protein
MPVAQVVVALVMVPVQVSPLVPVLAVRAMLVV